MNEILDPRSFPRPSLDAPDPAGTPMRDPAAGTTIIAPEARIEGAKISHCQILQVAGRLVDVTLTEIEVLEIASGGHFEGTAKVSSMRVAGKATGTIKVTGTLSVTESGHVDGTVRYGRISIADGGSITGTLQAATGAAE